MVSDAELVERLREILRNADLETTTATTVRRRLEEEFAVDLNGRRAFIRDQIDLFLQDNAAEGQEEGDENDQNDAVLEELENEDAQEDISCIDTDVKKKGGGFCKPCALSPQLEEFLGVSELARTEVVKKIWAYIKEKDLQNPKNRRKILCDEALRGIFRVNSIDMFQMNKVLSKHIWPLDEAEGPSPYEPKRKVKPKKGGGSGLTAPLPVSDALVKFFGTGEHELSRAEVVKKMWQYIKEHELQDPSDKRIVLCDDKLKELFEVDSFNGFTVSKLLTSHFIKTPQR
ncbi:hypothetical protein BUALT_Bualt15G0033200 [Buddleja alternifolia]|uniref:Upstream activation factor subunit spp27 n=1 Tax=Buddleja alternifolia TaxID=168488 RepID=A0AAV6WE02_9LAMI|nr:hypothetical protein BUALT_Bualt15G0033200 [Buddleja alternifolia]